MVRALLGAFGIAVFIGAMVALAIPFGHVTAASFILTAAGGIAIKVGKRQTGDSTRGKSPRNMAVGRDVIRVTVYSVYFFGAAFIGVSMFSSAKAWITLAAVCLAIGFVLMLISVVGMVIYWINGPRSESKVATSPSDISLAAPASTLSELLEDWLELDKPAYRLAGVFWVLASAATLCPDWF